MKTWKLNKIINMKYSNVLNLYQKSGVALSLLAFSVASFAGPAKDRTPFPLTRALINSLSDYDLGMGLAGTYWVPENPQPAYSAGNCSARVDGALDPEDYGTYTAFVNVNGGLYKSFTCSKTDPADDWTQALVGDPLKGVLIAVGKTIKQLSNMDVCGL